MTKTEYKKLLSWATKRGYRLHPNIEFKIENGIGGIYANSDIDAGSVLYHGPSAVIDKWDNVDVNIDYICDILREYLKGDSSEIHKMFLAFQSIESLKKNSIYFASTEELNTIQSISQPVYITIQRYISSLNQRLVYIREKFTEATDDDIMYILLNAESRMWGLGGFNPILDLFNHSSRFGMARSQTPDGFVLGNKVGIKKGEQVFDSYGINCIFHYLTSYSFFDKTDIHYSNIINRLDFPLDTELHKAQYNEITKKFSTEMIKVGDSDKFRILDNDILLTEYGPNHKFVSLVEIMATKDFSDKRTPTSAWDVLSVYLEWFNLMLNNVSIDNVDRNTLTDRVKMWYDGIKKDTQLISTAKQWAINTSPLLNAAGNDVVVKKHLESKK